MSCTEFSFYSGEEETVTMGETHSESLWYGASNCGGNADTLVEIVDLSKFHVTNVHEFEGYSHINRCLHDPYDKLVLVILLIFLVSL